MTVAFWNRKTQDVLTVDAGGEPLDATSFLTLIEDLARECAAEVGRLGGDPDRVIATIMFDDRQRITRVQLVSDGRPLLSGKGFAKQLSEQAAALANQPEGSRVHDVEATVVDGKVDTRITYRD